MFPDEGCCGNAISLNEARTLFKKYGDDYRNHKAEWTTDVIEEEKSDTKHFCPVCGQYEFESEASFDICPVCKWQDDWLQIVDPDEKYCANQMSLNEAKKAYKEGRPVE
ncbi:MAG: hypothetical protein GX802_01790 [Clostridiales bacterium]|nr:hypothetical protein [Clostridiales bacterium]